jgi:hypothetical protein
VVTECVCDGVGEFEAGELVEHGAGVALGAGKALGGGRSVAAGHDGTPLASGCKGWRLCICVFGSAGHVAAVVGVVLGFV